MINFRELEDRDFFIKTVDENYRNVVPYLQDFLDCEIEVCQDRLAYAYDEYMQGIRLFALYLQSGDPDHFKRAGALVHALYLSSPIIKVGFNIDLDCADTLSTPLGVSYGDAEGQLSFAHFYSEYHNQFSAFQLAYEICRQYTNCDVNIDFPYLHTVCAYMRNNGNLSVESLFMIYKSLMQ